MVINTTDLVLLVVADIDGTRREAAEMLIDGPDCLTGAGIDGPLREVEWGKSWGTRIRT